MQIYGNAGTTGGPLTGGHVPLPKKPVKHRGRPPQKPSGFVVHNTAEFTVEQLEPPKPRVGRKGISHNRTASHPNAVNLALPKEKVDELVRLYRDEGVSMKAAGAVVGVSHATVAKYLHRAGVQMRPRGNYRKPMEGPTEKVCKAPDCGAVFRRRDGEKWESWSKRLCCNRSCAARLVQALRKGTAA